MENDVPKFLSFRPGAPAEVGDSEKDTRSKRSSRHSESHKFSRRRSRSRSPQPDHRRQDRYRNRDESDPQDAWSRAKHDDRRDRPRSHHRERRDKPKGKRDEKHTGRVERSHSHHKSTSAALAHGHVENLFKVDTKGDQANLQYGQSHRWDVASYRTVNPEKVLGQTKPMSHSRPSDKGLISSMRKEDRRRLDTSSRPLLPSSSFSFNDLEADVIPLTTGQDMLDKDSGVLGLAPPFSGQGSVLLDLGTPGLENNTEEDDVETYDPGQRIRDKQQTLQKLAFAMPTHVQAWIDLVEFQDEWVSEGFGDQTGHSAFANLNTASQLKLDIISEGLPRFKDDMGALERLLLLKLQVVNSSWEPARVAEAWEEACNTYKTSSRLQLAHLYFTVESGVIGDCTEVKERFAAFLRGFKQRLSSRDMHTNHQEYAAVISCLTGFLNDAGYRELALAIWQVILGMAIGALRQGSSALQWADAWDSESSHLGESPASDLEKAEAELKTRLIQRPRDDGIRTSVWAQSEIRNTVLCWRPLADEENDGDEDIYRTVLPSDMEPFLVMDLWTPPGTDWSITRLWINAWLHHMDLPSLPPTSTDLVTSYGTHDIKSNIALTSLGIDSLYGASQQLLTPTSWVTSPHTLFASAERQICAFGHVDNKDPRIRFAINVLNELVQNIEQADKGLAEYIAALRRYSLISSWPAESNVADNVPQCTRLALALQAAQTQWYLRLQTKPSQDLPLPNEILDQPLLDLTELDISDQQEYTVAHLQVHKLLIDLYTGQTPRATTILRSTASLYEYLAQSSAAAKAQPHKSHHSYALLAAAKLLMSVLFLSATAKEYISTFETQILAFFSPQPSPLLELLHQHHAAQLYSLLQTHAKPYEPALLSATLARSQASFPCNTFIAQVRCAIAPFDRLRGLVAASEDEATARKSTAVSLLAHVEIELARLVTVPGLPAHAARAALERCVASHELAHRARVWMRYIELEESVLPAEAPKSEADRPEVKRRKELDALEKTRERVRGILHRAITACPWNKVLLLKGMQSAWLGVDDKKLLHKRMLSRHLRVFGESFED